ncbi:MAG: sugar phosphate isomerase/epimerase, partial [Clostridia bacterium]|nr:sugar phosphate isomerase/epimerase [Clostridia bacterium]
SSLVMDRSADREETLRDGRDLIDLCSSDGIGLIRVFPNEVFPDEDEKEALAYIASGLSALASYAEGKNVEILMEVHGNMTNLDRIRTISEAVPSPAFGILWDVAHTDKEYKDDFARFYRPILPRIRHVHIKDHIRLEKGTKLVDVGKGEVPLRAITESLLADGYDGFFSLEWEKMWHPELRDLSEELPLFVEYMRKIG